MSNFINALRNRAGASAAVLLVIAGAGALPSCNIVVPAAYIIGGPPSVDAEFQLPDRRTVVFIDDTRNMLPRTSLRTRIGDTTSTRLQQKEQITQAIAPSEAMQVARRFDSQTKRMSIRQIGEEVGAETIIHVKITLFALTPDGETPRPVAEAEVKVIDVAAGTRLYPQGPDGMRKVMAQLREQKPEDYRSSAGRRALEDALADELGKEIANLFHKHEKKELGENLGVRG